MLGIAISFVSLSALNSLGNTGTGVKEHCHVQPHDLLLLAAPGQESCAGDESLGHPMCA